MPRFLAVALVFVMTGAPVVTTACQAVCAAREGASAAIGEHHACHHEEPPANGLAITAPAHRCGHSDDSASAIDQSLQPLATPALVAATFAISPPALDARDPSSVRIEPSPPDPLTLNTQLRV
jgi:hypothetical protein